MMKLIMKLNETKIHDETKYVWIGVGIGIVGNPSESSMIVNHGEACGSGGGEWGRYGIRRLCGSSGTCRQMEQVVLGCLFGPRQK